MTIFQQIELMATWLECIIGVKMVSGIIAKKIKRPKGVYLFTLLIALIAYGINQIQLLSLVSSLTGVLGITFGVKIFYKAKVKDCLAGSVSYIILIYIIDFLTMSVCATVLGDEQFGMYITQGYSIWRIFYIILTKIILLGVYIFVSKKFVKGPYSINRNVWISIMILGIVVHYFGKITVRRMEDHLLIIWLFLIALTVTILYSRMQYLNYCDAEDKMKLAEERIQMVAENYSNLIKNYRDNQIHNHDLKNHYLVLQELLKEKKFDTAERYIEKLGVIREVSVNGDWTGISILDHLLEYKRNEALNKEITFQIISDKIHLKLTEQELVALFGNAIDNALEACEKIEPSKRWIRLSIRNVHNMTFIKIMNSSKEFPNSSQTVIPSTKEKSKKFGWGMTSMHLIVEKYNGTLKYNYRDSMFSLQISFYD
ncbi:MAG: sensor histidine kinase [Blautia hansenii]